MDKLAHLSLTKLYYSIGEVSKIFDVNTSLIRFWEKEFGLLQPKKNAKGNRLFTEKDIHTFNKIYQLVKVEGYTLEGAKNELKNKKKIADALVSKETTNDITLDLDGIVYRLEAIRSKLLRLKRL
jgi:DNA-binding transcriptional MerR regulator